MKYGLENIDDIDAHLDEEHEGLALFGGPDDGLWIAHVKLGEVNLRLRLSGIVFWKFVNGNWFVIFLPLFVQSLQISITENKMG